MGSPRKRWWRRDRLDIGARLDETTLSLVIGGAFSVSDAWRFFDHLQGSFAFHL
jgi:hypothetical protein